MADKWCDYGVFRVHDSADPKRIAEIKVRKDNGDKFGEETAWSRAKAVEQIESGLSLVTVRNVDGKYQRGEDVRVISIDGLKYLRTDRNNIKSDNLGELPKY